MTEIPSDKATQSGTKTNALLQILVAVASCSVGLLGTSVPTNAPLMSVGLDSIAATEFTNMLGDQFGSAIPATVLFDHPTLESITQFLVSEVCSEQDQGFAVLRTRVQVSEVSLERMGETGSCNTSIHRC